MSAPGPLLLLRSSAVAAAAAAGESPHWHAGGDLELWSTGTLSQGTRSPLFPFSFFLLVCLLRSLSLLPPSRSCHNICPARVLEGDRRSGGARLMCHFRGRRFENRTVERPLTRGAESISRFVDDLRRGCQCLGGLVFQPLQENHLIQTYYYLH